MTAATSDWAERIERGVVSASGVRALYPESVLPGAARVVLSERAGRLRCELKIAADRDVPATELIRAVADAATRALGSSSLELHIELASID